MKQGMEVGKEGWISLGFKGYLSTCGHEVEESHELKP